MPDRCRVTPEGFVWLLGAACQLHCLPFDATSLLKKFPLPHTMAVLRKALEYFGFRSAVAAVDVGGLQRLTFPCFALVPAGGAHSTSEGMVRPPMIEQSRSSHAEPSTDFADFVLLLKAEGDRVFYLAPDDNQPREAAAKSFLDSGLGLVLQIGRADKSSSNLGKHADSSAETRPSTTSITATEPQSSPRKNFRWFKAELRKHRAVWRTVLLASLIIQAIALAAPLCTRMIIDEVIVQQTNNTLVVLGFALAFFIVFTAVINWLRQYLVLQTSNRIVAVLGNRVLGHLLRLPLAFFETQPAGALLSRLQGVEILQRLAASTAFTVIFDFPFLLFFVATMFWLSWKLALLSLLVIGVIAVLSVSVMPMFRDHLHRQFLLGARNHAFLTEYLANMVTVKVLQIEPHFEKRYSDYLASYLAAGLSSRQAGNSYLIVTRALEQTMLLIILIAGSSMLTENTGFTIGALVAFLMLANRLGEPLLRLVGLWQDIQQATIAVDRLGEILDLRGEKHSASPPRGIPVPGRIDVENLAFRYSAEYPWIFRHLNVAFPAGGITVIKGASGSGKTTLGKLLQGFYNPQHGQIFLDGDDIQEFAANDLRDNFAVVPQETVLFAGTIYDNLVIRHPQASFEEALRACKAAGIHDLIDRLPDGYRTEIGEGGVGLSGGQRQRLALARALLRRPRILIIDEGLSNLDNVGIEEISQTINSLKGKTTIIYFGHEIPPGLKVDQLIDLCR